MTLCDIELELQADRVPLADIVAVVEVRACVGEQPTQLCR